jgi:hypothetical protein
MKTKIIIALLLCFGLVIFSGCASPSKKETDISKGQGLLEPSSMLKFSDVPVPAGFNLLAQNSYFFESQGVRVGVLKYQGRANPDRVINFYKEQMPMYNWTLLNITEFGERLMNFERENETCIISLLPKGNNISIIVSLGPKAQIRARKSKEPVK